MAAQYSHRLKKRGAHSLLHEEIVSEAHRWNRALAGGSRLEADIDKAGKGKTFEVAGFGMHSSP